MNIEVDGFKLAAKDIHCTRRCDERVVFLIATNEHTFFFGFIFFFEKFLEFLAEHISRDLIVRCFKLFELLVKFWVKVTEEVRLLGNYHCILAHLAGFLFIGVGWLDGFVFLPFGRKVRLIGAFDTVDFLTYDLAKKFNTSHYGFVLILVAGFIEDRGHCIEDSCGVREATDAGTETFLNGCCNVWDGHFGRSSEAFLVCNDVVVLVGAFDKEWIICNKTDVTVIVTVFVTEARGVVGIVYNPAVDVFVPEGFFFIIGKIHWVVLVLVDHWRATAVKNCA